MSIIGNTSKGKSPNNYKDSIGETFRKIPWARVVADAALKIVPKGTSFAVGLLPIPGAETFAGNVTKRLLEYTLHRFTHVYENGEVSFSDIMGRKIPAKTYQSVSDFWINIQKDSLPPKSLIKITGLLSPYGPLMPSHPLSRPGYTVQGWEAVGDLGVEDTEEYDTMDSFIYGDRVVRLSGARNDKYYAGLYDYSYGISNISLPLYIHKSAIRAKNAELEALWKNPMAGGLIVTLKGHLLEMPSFYSQFASQLPVQYRNLPSFGLEVFEVKCFPSSSAVTHMAVTVSWKKRKEERMLTPYFNVQDKSQFEAAEELMEIQRVKHKKSLLFNYDDLTCFTPNWKHMIPEYNEMLKPWIDAS